MSGPSRRLAPKQWYIRLHESGKFQLIYLHKLKKRQQKKTAGTPAANAPSSPLISPPISRAFSPAPSEPAEDEKKDIGDVYVQSLDNVMDEA
jgi:hypothetical protein